MCVFVSVPVCIQGGIINYQNVFWYYNIEDFLKFRLKNNN